jgi:hypothetical protein
MMTPEQMRALALGQPPMVVGMMGDYTDTSTQDITGPGAMSPGAAPYTVNCQNCGPGFRKPHQNQKAAMAEADRHRLLHGHRVTIRTSA